ncbi:MAG: hypothetical protein BWY76_03166 [bacterium ADurb.Bin429]|nr:MAG: hypothetical protein BWY76_03166 [bacterium ADurb.Bin429]
MQRRGSGQQAFRHGQVVGAGDLEIHRLAFHQVHAVSGALGNAGVIGDRPILGDGAGVDAPREVGAETLRCLRAPQPGAVHGDIHRAFGVRALERIGYRAGDHRRAMRARRVNTRADDPVRDEGPGGIVNEHDIRTGRHLLQALPDGIAPLRAARHHLFRHGRGAFGDERPCALHIILGNDEEDFRHRRMGAKGVEGVRQQRAPSQRHPGFPLRAT